MAELGIGKAMVRRAHNPTRGEYAALAGLQLLVGVIVVAIGAVWPAPILGFGAIDRQWHYAMLATVATMMSLAFGTGARARLERSLSYERLAIVDVFNVLVLNVGLVIFALFHQFSLGVFVLLGVSTVSANALLFRWAPGPRPSLDCAPAARYRARIVGLPRRFDLSDSPRAGNAGAHRRALRPPRRWTLFLRRAGGAGAQRHLRWLPQCRRSRGGAARARPAQPSHPVDAVSRRQCIVGRADGGDRPLRPAAGRALRPALGRCDLACPVVRRRLRHLRRGVGVAAAGGDRDPRRPRGDRRAGGGAPRRVGRLHRVCAPCTLPTWR